MSGFGELIRLLIIPFSFSARNEKTEAQLYTSAMLIPGLYFSRIDSISDIGIVLFSAKDAEFVLEFVLTFWNTQVVLQNVFVYEEWYHTNIADAVIVCPEFLIAIQHDDFPAQQQGLATLLFPLISEFKDISEHPSLLEYPEDDDQGYNHEQENHHPGPA